MSLKLKLIASFLAVAALVVAMGLVATRMAGRVEKAVEHLTHDTAPSVDSLGKIAVAWLQMEHAAMNMALIAVTLQESPQRAQDLENVVREEEQHFESGAVAMASAIEAYERAAADPREQALAEGFRAIKTDLETSWQTVLALKRRGASHEELTEAHASIEHTGRIFEMLVSAAVADEAEEFRESRLLVARETRTQRIVIAVSILLAVGLAIALGLGVARAIADPIRRLKDAALEVGRGHLDTRFESASLDEAGILGDAFNQMMEDLSRSTVSRSYLDNVIHSMADVLIVLEPNGRIRRVNRAAKELLGYEEAELAGQHAERLMGGGVFESVILEPLKKRSRVRDIEGMLLAKDGRQIPVLLSGAPIQEDWGEGNQGIVCIAKDITERKRAQQKIRELAYYDGLTGFPNRWFFQKRLRASLEWAKRNGHHLGLLYIDLDRLKSVNDTLGHSTGDRLLCEVSERLIENVKLSDYLGRPGSDDSQAPISRLGGDEFAILLTRIATPEDASRVAERVRDALAKPFKVGHQELFVTASIGIAVYPSGGENAEELLRNADTAMYHAKERGGNNWRYFEKSMNLAASRKLFLESRLRNALERHELALHYQPLREAASGRVIGAEALLRWTNPDTGPLTPAEFIPVAEETGLIIPIGAWALRTACAQSRAWQEAGYRPIRLSVNLSSLQFRQPALVETVARALEESGLSPAHLELEVTESAILEDDAATLATLRKLGDLGVGIALDDFGTGYSSLSYLRRFPFDRVKIARSFVAEITTSPSARALTTAIITMAHSLGLQVVAEGVETEAQAEHLIARRCDELQGFLFSLPVTAEEFVRFLEREKDPEP